MGPVGRIKTLWLRLGAYVDKAVMGAWMAQLSVIFYAWFD